MQKAELYKLDIDKIEVDIYWELLFNGRQSAYTLSKKLQLPRSTVYDKITRLTGLGYLNWSTENGNKRYVEASTPESVANIYKDKLAEIQDKQTLLNNLSNFYKESPQQGLQLDIKYYQGIKGIEQIVWNTLSCKSKIMYGFSDFNRNTVLSKRFIADHQREAEIRGPIDNIIINQSRVDEVRELIKEYPLKARVIPSEKFSIQGDTYIYDDMYAVTLFRGDNIYGFEIKNEEYAKLQLSLFMLLWEMGEEV